MILSLCVEILFQFSSKLTEYLNCELLNQKHTPIHFWRSKPKVSKMLRLNVHRDSFLLDPGILVYRTPQ